MAAKYTSNNSLLFQRDWGLWLLMLTQKQSIQCLGRRQLPLCGPVDIAWKTIDGVSPVLGFLLKMSNDLSPCPLSCYQPWTPQRTRAKTIVQPLFPFHGKQNVSISQTAFEYLTWLNQTSLHHVAVIQPSDAEKREQSIFQEHIQRSKLPSCLHQLRSPCKDEWFWNENAPLWEERKRDHSLPLVVL